MNTTLKILTLVTVWLIAGSLALAQAPAAQEQVAALKASLAASQTLLKQYEWVETTVVSVKGEEKSRQMNRCYHGADGIVQKVPLTTPAPEQKKHGLRGKIAESKREEMTDYMREAVGLVKLYVPPSQARIQAAKEAGKVSVTPLPGQQVRLTFADYVKTGDSLALEFDVANHRPLQARVATFLDSRDPVTLDVRFDTLENHATYASKSVLNAPAKHLTVSVQNSGYRQTSN